MLWQWQYLKTAGRSTFSSQPGWIFYVHFPSGAVLQRIWIKLKIWIYKCGIFGHAACSALNLCSLLLHLILILAAVWGAEYCLNVIKKKKAGESQVSRGRVWCALISTIFGVSEVAEKSQNHLLWGSERSLCWELHPSSLHPDHQRRGSIQHGHDSPWHVACVLAQYFTKTRGKGIVFNVIVFTLRKIFFFFYLVCLLNLIYLWKPQFPKQCICVRSRPNAQFLFHIELVSSTTTCYHLWYALGSAKENQSKELQVILSIWKKKKKMA